MKTLDWLQLFALSLLWGGSFFFNEIALRELPVLTIVAARVALAAVILWLLVAISGYQLPKRTRHWLWYFTMGMVNNAIPFSLLVFAQQDLTAGLTSILNATTPFFIVVVIALFYRGESVTRTTLAGLTLGFSGVVLMLGPDLVGTDSTGVSRQIAVLFAALSYALAGLYGRRFHSAGIAPIVAAAGQVTMSAIILVPIALFMEGAPSLKMTNLNSWVAVAALAIFSTAIAYVLYFRILSTAGSVNLMLVTFLMPVTALLLGTFLLNEPVRAIEIAGITIIGIALLIIDGRLLRRASSVH